MLKDFHISPEYVLPKVISEVFKSISNGSPLDIHGFREFLAKCAYKSEKIAK